jgi:hypothetical protein
LERHGLSARWTLAGAVGAALVPLTLRGQSLDGGSQSTRLDSRAPTSWMSIRSASARACKS